MNGTETPRAELADALGQLTDTRGDAIVLRANETSRLSDISSMIDLLTTAGYTTLVLAE
ncbi:MAG: hypothetical protein AAF761_04445 [Pseudomonadota bacterium]